MRYLAEISRPEPTGQVPEHPSRGWVKEGSTAQEQH